MPDGTRMQVPGQAPQGDRATLPSNPFPDDAPDVPPPTSNPPPADQGPQAAPPSGTTSPAPAPRKSASTPAAPVSPDVQSMQPGRALPNSLLDKPAEPAKVTLDDGQLAVHADNSSLSQILHQLASASGMKVDGLSQDQRVFGSYGPGDPRDVLTSLLDGANYNVLMVGSTRDGAPRELILSPRSGGAITTSPNTAAADQDNEDDQSVQNVEDNPQPEFSAPPQIPAAPVQQQNPNGTVKTPQQILQELEQMRQQQQPH